MNHKYGSGEYAPTPSHMLPAFTNGKPRGYMCVVCGHMEVELDPFWEDICPMCLKSWARRNLPKMIPTAEAIDQGSPLIPTVKVVNANADKTTRIMSLKDKHT